jgi:ATP-dependent RNA helicase DOB1
VSLTILVELRAREAARDEMVIPDEKEVADYYAIRKQLDQMAADFREIVTHPSYSIPFLQPGRLVKIKYGQLDFGWGVICNYQKRLPPKVRLLSLNWHGYRGANFVSPEQTHSGRLAAT